MRLDLNFKNEEEKKAFVEAGEHEFRGRLSDAVKRCKNENAKIITVTGPSCSGKTTASNRLIGELESDGSKVKVVSVDNFFRSRSQSVMSESIETLDLDSVKALDIECFESYMNDLYAGKSRISEPVFDISIGERIGYSEFSPEDYDVFLFEGIQVVYPEVSRCFEKFPCVHMFLSVSDGIEINGSCFEASEVRFLRRLVRDCKFRGSIPDFVFEYWNTVRNNEKKNIEPYVENIEIKINSLLKYELCVIKPYAIELIGRLTNKEFATAAESILKRFENIPDITAEYVPLDSVFREFIG